MRMFCAPQHQTSTEHIMSKLEAFPLSFVCTKDIDLISRYDHNFCIHINAYTAEKARIFARHGKLHTICRRQQHSWI